MGEENIIADTTQQIISTIVDTVSHAAAAPATPVDTSVCYYDLFPASSIITEQTLSSINDLFGTAATVHGNFVMTPVITGEVFSWTPFYQYILVFTLILVSSFIVYKFSEHVGRLLGLTFSFPRLYRQLESTNNTIDTTARSISSLTFFSMPLVFLSFNHYVTNEFSSYSILLQIAIGFGLGLGIYLYNVIFKFIFYHLFQNRYFYRRLFIAERICISSYALILLPVILLAAVQNPYQEELIKAQFLMIILFGIHYLITIFKLFIEEKVSYVQLILYFCTVKAVIISLIIYFGILWL